MAVLHVNVGITRLLVRARSRMRSGPPDPRRTAHTSPRLVSCAGDSETRTRRSTTSSSVRPLPFRFLVEFWGGMTRLLRVNPPDVFRHVVNRGLDPSLGATEGLRVRPPHVPVVPPIGHPAFV